MEYRELLGEIIKLGPAIRFVGMYDSNFNKITDDFSAGTYGYLSRDEQLNSIRYDIRRWETYKMFRTQLGETHFAMVKYDKAILLTFPIGEGEHLRISIEPDSDYKTIIEKVEEIIKKNPVFTKS